MEVDNVAAPGRAGFAALGPEPRSIESTLQMMLGCTTGSPAEQTTPHA
jgi:hypothetical protein